MANTDRISEVAGRLEALFGSIKFRTDGEVLEADDFESMLSEVKMAYDDYIEIQDLLRV